MRSVPTAWFLRTSTAQFDRWVFAFRRKLSDLPTEDIDRLVQFVHREVDPKTARCQILPEERSALELLLEEEPSPQLLGRTLQAAFTQFMTHWNTVKSFVLDRTRFDRLDEVDTELVKSLKAEATVERTPDGRRTMRPLGQRFRFLLPPTAEVLSVFLAVAARYEYYYLPLYRSVHLTVPEALFRDVLQTLGWVPSERVRAANPNEFSASQKLWFFHQLAHVGHRYGVWLSTCRDRLPALHVTTSDDGNPGLAQMDRQWIQMVDGWLVQQWLDEIQTLWDLRPGLFNTFLLSQRVASIWRAMSAILHFSLFILILGLVLSLLAEGCRAILSIIN